MRFGVECFLWLSICGFAVGNFAEADEVQFMNQTRFTDGSRFMLLGDSFSNDGNADWAGKVRDLPPLDMVYFSASGRRLDQMALMLENDLETALQGGEVEAIVIAGGINNFANNRYIVPELKSYINSMVSNVGDRHIILTTIPPFKGRGAFWTESRQQQADEYDLWIRSLPESSERFSIFDIGALLDQNDDNIIDPEFASSDMFHPQACIFGETCGMSLIADSFIQQFSASAVPEPSSATIVLVPLVFAVCRRRRSV